MTDPLSLWWSQTRTTAMLGTGRRPVGEPPPLPVTARPGAAPEVTLLDHLALAGSWQAAGMRPRPAEPPAPAPEDPVPVAPPAAVRLLELALSQTPGGLSNREQVVRLWSTHAEAAGYRAPDRLLPDLLDLLVKRGGTGEPLPAVLGQRGRWLAEQSPSWRPLLRTTPAPGAPVGSPEWLRLPVPTQAAGLAELHATEPEHARRTVQRLLDEASAADRVTYLGALESHLTPDDEPVLEAALLDRSAKVRDLAVRLLDRLPTSRRSRRMAERLQSLITVDRSLLRRTLRVQLPELDDDIARDGLAPTTAELRQRWQEQQRRAGVRSTPPPADALDGLRQVWQLEQLVAASPLSVWDVTGLKPDQIVGQLQTAWRGAGLAGLHRATIAQRDATWAMALLQLPGPHDPALFGVLSRQDAEQLVLAQLVMGNRHDTSGVLRRLDGPWSPSFSQDVVDHLGRGKGGEPDVGPVLEFGDRLDTSVLPRLRRWLEGIPATAPLHRPLALVVSLLSFRQSISEAFQ